MRFAALALAALLGVSGCSGDPGEPRDILDGEPRIPDDEGVVTNLTVEKVTLDGERTYRVSKDLIAFSPSTLKLERLVKHLGQYVHVGLDGKTVVWMSGFGAVLPDDDTAHAFYTGVVEAFEGHRITFTDGTVMRVHGALENPGPGRQVQVQIDAEQRRVTAFIAIADPAPSTTTTTASSAPDSTTTTTASSGAEADPGPTTEGP